MVGECDVVPTRASERLAGGTNAKLCQRHKYYGGASRPRDWR